MSYSKSISSSPFLEWKEKPHQLYPPLQPLFHCSLFHHHGKPKCLSQRAYLVSVRFVVWCQAICLVLLMKLAKLAWVYAVKPCAILCCGDAGQAKWRNGSFGCLLFLLLCQRFSLTWLLSTKRNRDTLKWIMLFLPLWLSCAFLFLLPSALFFLHLQKGKPSQSSRKAWCWHAVWAVPALGLPFI